MRSYLYVDDQNVNIHLLITYIDAVSKSMAIIAFPFFSILLYQRSQCHKTGLRKGHLRRKKTLANPTCWGSLEIDGNNWLPLLQHVVTPEITMAEAHLPKVSWQRPVKKIFVQKNIFFCKKMKNLCPYIFFGNAQMSEKSKILCRLHFQKCSMQWKY